MREALSEMQLEAARRGNAPREAVPGEKHTFWDTQPVPSFDDDTDALEPAGGGPIHPAEPDKVKQEPYSLPGSFEWAELDLTDEAQANELYTLLHENYVEDGDNMFRFDYSIPFIRWAMQPPGHRNEWHVGVRVSQTKKLVAFIGCTPADLLCHGKRVEPGPVVLAEGEAEPSNASAASKPADTAGGEQQSVVEVNFLCVHKKLRSKRLAPVLIREITRRVNLHGIFQASYTAGVVLPKPVARCRYWHRSLNPKKLIEVGFSALQPRMTMVRTLKLYALPEAPLTPGVRPITPADVAACCPLLNDYLRRFAIAPQLSEEEFRHWMLTREGVVYTFVVEDPATKAVTDMFSFYSLPSSILKHEKHTRLHAAYCYYYFSTRTPLRQLLTDALILAKKLEFDVFNALDLLDNKEHLRDLKFGIGDGHLQYYLYNWRCTTIQPEQVGLVLL